MGINKLMEDLETIRIAGFDADTRFRTFAACGSVKKGLAIVDQRDFAFMRKAK